MAAEKGPENVGKKRWTLIVVGAAALVLLLAGRLLPLNRWLDLFNDWIVGFGPVGMVVFAAAYAVATVLFIPGSILTLGAGFAFGIGKGTVVVSLGSIVGAGLAFLIARYLARERIAALARRNDKFAAIDRSIGAQGWKIVLLLRLSPLIPFNASNYLYGLTSVRFWPYLFASWIGMLPGTALYVYLGAAGSAGLRAAGGSVHRTLLQNLYLSAGLIATLAVTWYVSRLARKALNSDAIRLKSERQS